MTGILAIDAGNTESGWVVLDANRVLHCGIDTNVDLLRIITGPVALDADILAIEMMRARGMPMSNEAMETLVWVGRFQQAWHKPDEVMLVYRSDVKMHICGSSKAKDSNVNTALRDIVGKPGTKKNPGPTYGVTSHAWAALGVAVTAEHQLKERASRRRARL